MANCDRALALFYVAVFLISSWMPLYHCAKKPVALARKEDVPYIKCQVCQKLASQVYHQVQAKQAEISPKRLSEYQIIEIAENVCNLKKQEADWILKIDIVEKGRTLELVEQDAEGQCNSECKTIERACQEVLGYSDTDVAEYLYKNKPNLDSLVDYVCKDLTDACSSKPPPVPKDRIPGEPFVAKSPKDAEMERLMKSMEGLPGAPGMKMYSREDLMNQKFGDEDADDDEDGQDAEFPAKLGKVLRDKDSTKYDWKEKVVQEAKDASNKLRHHAMDASNKLRQHAMDASKKLRQHAHKVSNKIRRWWKSKTVNVKSGKAEL